MSPPLRIFAGIALTVAYASAAATTADLLTFDDLSPPPESRMPLFDLPDPYRDLHFTRFTVFEPRNRSLDNILHPLDRNCAVSAPNALVGSALEIGHRIVPTFEVSTSRDGGDQDAVSFDLIGMAMKPFVAPPGKEEITIWVKGYSTHSSDEQGDKELLWHVDFPVGWHTPFVPQFPDHWQQLRKVEMWAEYGPTKLDWEFCIDDLKLRWHRRRESSVMVEL